MTKSVQLYTLETTNHQPIVLRELSTRIPLACKQPEVPLTPLEGTGTITTASGKQKAVVVLDTQTLKPQLKSNGNTYDLIVDAEWQRLQQHMLRCWLNLLKARQANGTASHQKEIEAARQALKNAS